MESATIDVVPNPTILQSTDECYDVKVEAEAIENLVAEEIENEVLEFENSHDYEGEPMATRVFDTQAISENGACNVFDEMLQPVPICLKYDAFLFEDEDNDNNSSKIKSQQSNALGTVIEGDKVIVEMFKLACAHDFHEAVLPSPNSIKVYDENDCHGDLGSQTIGLQNNLSSREAVPKFCLLSFEGLQKVGLLKIMLGEMGVFLFDPGILHNQFMDGMGYLPLSKIESMFVEVPQPARLIYKIEQPQLKRMRSVKTAAHQIFDKITETSVAKHNNGIETVNNGIIDSNGVKWELWLGNRLLFTFDPGGCFVSDKGCEMGRFWYRMGCHLLDTSDGKPMLPPVEQASNFFICPNSQEVGWVFLLKGFMVKALSSSLQSRVSVKPREILQKTILAVHLPFKRRKFVLYISCIGYEVGSKFDQPKELKEWDISQDFDSVLELEKPLVTKKKNGNYSFLRTWNLNDLLKNFKE